MNVADNAPAAGLTITAVLYAIGHIIVAVSKALKERERRKAMASVPPTIAQPPPPAVDQAILARLDRAEQHDALLAALFRAQADAVDDRRKLEVLREECSRLALRVHELESERDRLRTQVSVERQAVQILREQLAHVEAEREQLVGDLRRALLVRG